MNSPHRHVPVRRLAEYLLGEMSLLKRVDLELHVRACAHCAGRISELEHIINGLRAESVPDESASVVERAVQQFRSKKLRLPTASHVLRRVLAVLEFDSAGLMPSLGVRSGARSVRQLVFNAESDRVDLRIEPLDRAWAVSGQILGKSPIRGSVILQGDAGTHTAVLNELSEFVLSPVNEGSYSLTLKLTTAQVQIEEIKIGP